MCRERVPGVDVDKAPHWHYRNDEAGVEIGLIRLSGLSKKKLPDK